MCYNLKSSRIEYSKVFIPAKITEVSEGFIAHRIFFAFIFVEIFFIIGF